jgi:glycosyltransferase involved in cell wall biosynthesis
MAALPLGWLRLRRLIHDADIIHVNDHRGLVLTLPFLFRSRRIVWHLHSGADVGRLGAFLTRIARSRAAIILVPSKAAFPGVELGSRVFELPNAVGVGATTSRSFAPVAGRLVAVARWHPDKGLDVLLDAVSLLAARGAKTELHVVGGPVPGEELYGDDLLRRASTLGTVTMLGHLESPSEVLVQAQVYVQPSRAESFGLAALEASAAGLPVVASAVGGLRDVVLAGETGLLVEPDDPVALADAIQELLDDPSRARSLGDAGRRRALADFSSERFADRLAEAYELAWSS